MSTFSKLNKARGFCFAAAVIIGKVPYFSLTIFTPILNLCSLGFYLLAYTLWLISTHYYPEHTKHKKWYGFAQFKEQHSIAATLGIIASVMSVFAIVSSIVLIPAAWIFLVGNLIWLTSEYHKFNNPFEEDELYSTELQKTYITYAGSVTTISLIGAISTTLMFVFPPIAFSLFVASTCICVGLSLLSLEYWLSYNAKAYNHKPPTLEKKGSSYQRIMPSLALKPFSAPEKPSITPQPHNKSTPPETYESKSTSMRVKI